MIRGSVEWKTSDALLRRLNEVREATRPGSRVQSRIMGDLKKIVEEDHYDKLQRGVNRYGQPFEHLAESTSHQARCSPKILIPCGPQSWPWWAFEVVWKLLGNNTTVIQAKYNYDPKIVAAHEKGASKPGTKWRLPARPTMGVTPKGWARIRARVKQIPADLLKWGGGR